VQTTLVTLLPDRSRDQVVGLCSSSLVSIQFDPTCLDVYATFAMVRLRLGIVAAFPTFPTGFAPTGSAVYTRFRTVAADGWVRTGVNVTTPAGRVPHRVTTPFPATTQHATHCRTVAFPGGLWLLVCWFLDFRSHLPLRLPSFTLYYSRLYAPTCATDNCALRDGSTGQVCWFIYCAGVTQTPLPSEDSPVYGFLWTDCAHNPTHLRLPHEAPHLPHLRVRACCS